MAQAKFLNSHVWACILDHLDALDTHADSRIQQTYFALSLTCKELQLLVTPGLYRFPYLDKYSLPGFSASIASQGSLALLVRGITFNTTAGQSKTFGSEQSKRLHQSACSSFRAIMTKCTNLDSFAADFRSGSDIQAWHLDASMDFDPDDPTIDIYRTIFGHRIRENAGSASGPFKHVCLDDTTRHKLPNVWRGGQLHGVTMSHSDNSLTFHDVDDDRPELLCMPLYEGPLTLTLSSSHLLTSNFSEMLARARDNLVQLRLYRAVWGVDVDFATPVQTLPALRILTTDTLPIPPMSMPSLQELRVSLYGINIWQQVQSFLTSGLIDTAVLRLVRFDRYLDYYLTYREHMETMRETIAMLDILCREQDIRIVPSVRDLTERIWAAREPEDGSIL